MKWYEYAVDHGDGTAGVKRFTTREKAQASRDKAEESPYWISDGDDSPVEEVDTDSGYFFDDDEEDEE